MGSLSVWVNRMRPVRTPEAAYRSARHVVYLACTVVFTLPGAFLAVGLAFAPLPPSARRYPLAILGAALWAVAGMTGLAAALRPRRRTWEDPPPARAEEDGLTLPLRRLPRLANPIWLGLIGVLMTGYGAGTLDVDRLPALTILGGGLFILGLIAVGIGHSAHVRLTPSGLVLPSWDPAKRDVDWEEIKTIEVLANMHPQLVVTLRDGTRRTASLHLLAWSPSAVLAAVEHFDKNKSARARLTDPAALERFRTWKRR